MGQYLSYPTPQTTSSDNQVVQSLSVQRMKSWTDNTNLRAKKWIPCELCGKPVCRHHKDCSENPKKFQSEN